MDKSRAEFEAWLMSLGVPVDLRKIGQIYRNPYIEARWRGWLGRELT